MTEIVEIASWAEMFVAAQMGVLRHLHNLLRKNSHRVPMPPDYDHWGSHIEAAGAEQAVAKRYNIYWTAFYSSPRELEGDVGKIQVRSTTRDDGSLIIMDTDSDEAPFILARGLFPKWELAGWMYGRECKVERFWEPKKMRKPCWVVPGNALRDMETFPAEEYGGKR